MSDHRESLNRSSSRRLRKATSKPMPFMLGLKRSSTKLGSPEGSTVPQRIMDAKLVDGHADSRIDDGPVPGPDSSLTSPALASRTISQQTITPGSLRSVASSPSPPPSIPPSSFRYSPSIASDRSPPRSISSSLHSAITDPSCKDVDDSSVCDSSSSVAHLPTKESVCGSSVRSGSPSSSSASSEQQWPPTPPPLIRERSESFLPGSPIKAIPIRPTEFTAPLNHRPRQSLSFKPSFMRRNRSPPDSPPPPKGPPAPTASPSPSASMFSLGLLIPSKPTTATPGTSNNTPATPATSSFARTSFFSRTRGKATPSPPISKEQISFPILIPSSETLDAWEIVETSAAVLDPALDEQVPLPSYSAATLGSHFPRPGDQMVTKNSASPLMQMQPSLASTTSLLSRFPPPPSIHLVPLPTASSSQTPPLPGSSTSGIDGSSTLEDEAPKRRKPPPPPPPPRKVRSAKSASVLTSPYGPRLRARPVEVNPEDRVSVPAPPRYCSTYDEPQEQPVARPVSVASAISEGPELVAETSESEATDSHTSEAASINTASEGMDDQDNGEQASIYPESSQGTADGYDDDDDDDDEVTSSVWQTPLASPVVSHVYESEQSYSAVDSDSDSLPSPQPIRKQLDLEHLYETPQTPSHTSASTARYAADPYTAWQSPPTSFVAPDGWLPLAASSTSKHHNDQHPSARVPQAPARPADPIFQPLHAPFMPAPQFYGLPIQPVPPQLYYAHPFLPGFPHYVAPMLSPTSSTFPQFWMTGPPPPGGSAAAYHPHLIDLHNLPPGMDSHMPGLRRVPSTGTISSYSSALEHASAGVSVHRASKMPMPQYHSIGASPLSAMPHEHWPASPPVLAGQQSTSAASFISERSYLPRSTAAAAAEAAAQTHRARHYSGRPLPSRPRVMSYGMPYDLDHGPSGSHSHSQDPFEDGEVTPVSPRSANMPLLLRPDGPRAPPTKIAQ